MRGLSRRSRVWIAATAATGAAVIGFVVSEDQRASEDPRADVARVVDDRAELERADGVRDGRTPVTSTNAPTTTTSAPTTTTRGPLGSGRSVTIAFGGDVHFEGVIRSRLDTEGSALLDAVAPLVRDADLAVVNLETAITERGTAANKAYTFRAPARALDSLLAAGIDVVSAANNHGLDYGDDGLVDTLEAERTTGMPIIGIGRDDREAYAPELFRVRGQRIAVIGATQVLDDALISDWTAGPGHRGLASAKEVDRLVAEVRRARARADTVVVFLHWGTEKMTCPQDRQTTLARQLVDAGADIVVGGHAHRLQGAGRLDDAFVAYGLGNFVFYTQGGPGAETGVLTVTVTGRRIDGYEWTPARLSNGVPVPLTGDEATSAVGQWQALRGCTDLRP
jgi:poly-gamma-glutamate synthesis protein (capsule biosynthesis protein)